VKSDGCDALDGQEVANPSGERYMRRTIALAVLAVIVIIIAVQFGPSLLSH
jgi:hypothetical protein